MTSRLLTALHSLLEGATLARTVHRLAREHDRLSALAQLEGARADRAEAELDARLTQIEANRVELDAALDGWATARARVKAWKASARRYRGEVANLTSDASRLADAALDSMGAGELCASTLAALQVEHERLRGDFDRVSRSWGESVRRAEGLEVKLRAEEARTSVLRAEIASLRAELGTLDERGSEGRGVTRPDTMRGLAAWISPPGSTRTPSVHALAFHVTRLLAARLILEGWATGGARFLALVECEIGLYDVEPEGVPLWSLTAPEAPEILAAVVAYGTRIQGWERAMVEASRRLAGVVRGGAE